MATKAFVLLNIELGAEEDVLKQLRGMEEVKEAYIVYGIYDIIVKIEAPSLDEIRQLVTNKIRRIDKVRSTLTMIVVEGS